MCQYCDAEIQKTYYAWCHGKLKRREEIYQDSIKIAAEAWDERKTEREGGRSRNCITATKVQLMKQQ